MDGGAWCGAGLRPAGAAAPHIHRHPRAGAGDCELGDFVLTLGACGLRGTILSLGYAPIDSAALFM